MGLPENHEELPGMAGALLAAATHLACLAPARNAGNATRGDRCRMYCWRVEIFPIRSRKVNASPTYCC